MKKFILNAWKTNIEKSDITILDSKTKLQEYSLKRFKKLPFYRLVNSTGPRHNPLYKISVSINRIGKMPMPIEVEVLYEDFSAENYYIPLSIMRGEKDNSDNKLIILEDWEWVNESYQIDLDDSDKKIKKIEINPSGKLADVDKTNNIIEF